MPSSMLQFKYVHKNKSFKKYKIKICNLLYVTQKNIAYHVYFALIIRMKIKYYIHYMFVCVLINLICIYSHN